MRISERILRHRSKWKYNGKIRPDFAIKPKDGQESVWDYPRPPKLENDERQVQVIFNNIIIADTVRATRVLETASPPVFYIPPEDIKKKYLLEGSGSSICEWKGEARYWTIKFREIVIENVGWSYPVPFEDYENIAEYISFYTSRLECFVNGERAEPQHGGFYGGWVTHEIVGPFKGLPGTEWW